MDFGLSVGERAALIGPSGAGKSLLLRTLCGLDRPDEGEVRFRGEVVGGGGTPSLRARVLYVQQQPVLIPGDVGANLDVPLEFRVHRDRDGRNGAAPELFDRLGKPSDFLSRRVSVLSGGEGQLVGLVRALLLDPEVLLLDEPTAHLDLETTRRVEELVREWVRAGERAVVWTSHDPTQVHRVREGPLLELGAGE